MSDVQWEQMQGTVLGCGYQIGHLIRTESNSGAIFTAAAKNDSQSPQELFIILEGADGTDIALRLNRYREASFLNHPNLIHVFDAGRCQIAGKPYIYALCESADSALKDFVSGGPVKLEDAHRIAGDVVAGLAYLHSENLVCCVVRTQGIWRVDQQWKIADYSELRVAGKYRPQDTRSLMLTRDSNAPPEAYMGMVSPAWDVWCLGAMLREILAPGGKAAPLPAPFDAIVRDSLAPNPAERITLEEVGRLLAEANIQPAVLEPEPETPLPRHLQQPVLTTPGLDEGRPFLLVAAAACILALLILIFHHRPVAANPYAPGNVTNTKASPAPPPAVSSSPEPETKPASAVAQSDAEREIASLLNRWEEAARNRNLAGQLSCYAPVLDRFFGRRRVTADELRREKQRVFSQAGSIRRFDIGNIRFDRVTDHWAVVSFDKDWAFGGAKPFEGRARDEFVLRPIDGQWKIASERELKVYWTSKSGSIGPSSTSASPSSSPSALPLHPPSDSYRK